MIFFEVKLRRFAEEHRHVDLEEPRKVHQLSRFETPFPLFKLSVLENRNVEMTRDVEDVSVTKNTRHTNATPNPHVDTIALRLGHVAPLVMQSLRAYTQRN